MELGQDRLLPHSKGVLIPEGRLLPSRADDSQAVGAAPFLLHSVCHVATKVMGWHVEICGDGSDSGEMDEWWCDRSGQPVMQVDVFRPDEDRDQLAEVEAKLTEEQSDDYLTRIYRQALSRKRVGARECDIWAIQRYADPAVCVDAIVDMLLEAKA